MHRVNILYTPVFVTVLMATVVVVAMVSVFALSADRLVVVTMSLVALGVIWVASSFVYLGVGGYNLWISDEPQTIDWVSIAWGLSGAVPLVVGWISSDPAPHFASDSAV